jgi:hypothetical protein
MGCALHHVLLTILHREGCLGIKRRTLRGDVISIPHTGDTTAGSPYLRLEEIAVIAKEDGLRYIRPGDFSERSGIQH